MKVVIAGQGAFGQRHIEACREIPGIEVVSLAGGNPAGTEETAKNTLFRATQKLRLALAEMR